MPTYLSVVIFITLLHFVVCVTMHRRAVLGKAGGMTKAFRLFHLGWLVMLVPVLLSETNSREDAFDLYLLLGPQALGYLLASAADLPTWAPAPVRIFFKCAVQTPVVAVAWGWLLIRAISRI